MKHILSVALSLFFWGMGLSAGQNKIMIPDSDNYLILTGDMHLHTVFSDGNVWPTTRVDEAYAEGVEVICITDHLDQRKKTLANKGDFNGDRNYSYDVAAKYAKSLGVIVIKGAEITRGMPPGHFNTLFITDVEPIAQANDAHSDHREGMLAGLKVADSQKAFCVWNHPHWHAQQPKAIWHPEHEEIFSAGYMHGVEAYNYFGGFSWEAFQWAIDKGLTLICGTDMHSAMFRSLNFQAGELRPVTLIFAKQADIEGVKEALVAGRTAIFADGCVYGSEAMLTELVSACIKVKSINRSKTSVRVALENKSSIPFRMRGHSGEGGVSYANFNLLYPFEIENFSCSAPVYKAPFTLDEFTLSFDIENFYTAPGKNFNYKIHISCPLQ